MSELFIAGFIIFAVIVAFVCEEIETRRVERETWNDGICAISQKPWILLSEGYFGDSHAGEAYHDGEGNHCWITYRTKK